MMKTLRRILGRPRVGLVALFTAAILVAGRGSGWLPLQAQNNPIVTENNLPGATENWDIAGAGDPSIQGFASDISVNVGATVDFKIKLTAPTASYTIDIYRLGYYQGLGARKVGTVVPTTAQLNAARAQPACDSTQFGTTGLVDCGNWGVSGSFSTAGLTSGIFLARPKRTDTAGASHIVFMVRDDNRTADVLFQTSDTTWQAYNQYPGVGSGGASLYCGGPVSNAGTAYSCTHRATKVSYNRPFDTRAHNATSWIFNGEYPMVRFLEANGYDVKYWAGVDTDRFGAQLTDLHKPKAFLSVGHDEYWSGAQRTSVENARNAGVNLAFFSGNEMFWKTRYEPSIAGPSGSHRTLVSYKETLAGAKIDPAVDGSGNPIWTGTWRDPRFSPPADGGRPENGIIGQIWTVVTGTTAIKVPAEMKGLRLWKNTRIESLQPGEVATLAQDTLGYEWGEDLDNGSRPAGVIHLSTTTMTGVEKIIDYGSTVGTGTATHHLTMYKHNSGALVFGAGTVQWAWGLDGTHDLGSPAAHVPDHAMQQATVNLLADMGAQPGSLQVGAGGPTQPLIGTSASSDQNAPTTTITSPANGGQVENGNRVTISGTATENGGGVVAGVEVSVDGGTTWRAATGTSTWSFDWSPGVLGSATIRARAIDDSGNLESAGPGTTVSVVVGACPCTTLWKASTLPTNSSAADTSPYELGVKFKSDIDGFITGIRFYKGTANSGTHLGHLWHGNTGAMLAEATFTNETATGWQQVLFATPVAITANTTYVASYHTNVGGYAFDAGYFAASGVDSPPLHALPSNTSGGNGVFSPGGVGFPSNTFNANNYWVDVVFAPSLQDSTPPAISNIKSTTIDSSRVTVNWSTDEPANSRLDYGTNPAILTASLSNLPPGTQTVVKSPFATQHTVALTGLQPNTTYYYLVTAVDHSGNATTVAAPSFTVPGPTLRDTALTDFSSGTQAATYVSQTADGEVILAPTTGSEFTGPGMPVGWTSVAWDAEGYSTIQDGVLLVDGARVASCVTDVNGVCLPEDQTSTTSAIYSAPHSLEFSARFSGDQFQHAGFAVTFGSGSEPWAIFSTLSGGLLFARTNTGAGAIDTPLGTGLLGSFHHYRIDWKPASVDYYVDGGLVVSHPVTVAGPMRPVAASDFNPFGGNVFVDWMRMSSYAASGTFLSRVFDASSPVAWHSIQWAAKAPAGTTVAISVRTGDTPTPDGTWSGFVPVAAPGPLTQVSQYIQYRAAMTSGDPNVTPALEDIILSTGHAPVANADSATVPQNGNRIFPASGPGSLTENDTDADTVNSLLRVVAVTPAAHGTVVVNGDGSVTYTPATNYNGPDAFTYTVIDGLLASRATVTLDVRFGNVAPVATNDFYTTNEEVTLTVPVAAGILANDTDVEHDALTAVLVTLPQHGMLTLSGNGAFIYTPALNYAGPDAFTYQANDGTDFGNTATVQLMVNQVNDAPITEPDAFTAVLNTEATVLPLNVPAPGVLRNDHDVEVEDTTPMHVALVSTTTRGLLTLNSDGSFSYTPSADFLGTDSFTYRAIDHLGAPGNVATVTITVAIKAVSEVVAGGATVATGTGVSAADPLQSSVTSPTSATVSIAQGVISGSASPSGYTFLNQQVNITITGADGTELTALLANPIRLVFTIDDSLIPTGQDHLTFQMFRNGVVIPNCLGHTSIPAANLDPCVTAREALGSDVRLTIITSHASRWNMGLASASAQPVTRNDGVSLVDFATPLTVTAPGVLGNDYGKSSLTSVLTPGSVLGGTVDLAPSGGFTFTPTAGLCGPASFRYKAVDANLQESAEGTVSLTIDCTPQPGDDATTVLEDSGASTITVLSNDTDPDPAQTLAVIAVTQGANGTVAIVGSGMAVTYKPNANFFGTDSFTYTVSDGHNGSAIAAVNITVTSVNDAPSFTNGASQTVAEDSGPRSVAGFATALSAGPASESSQALSFTVTNGNNSLFSAQPAIAADGTLSFTPAADANGSATVSVRIKDDGGVADGGVDTSAPQTFLITVTPVNDLPVSVDGALNTDEDTPKNGTLVASDVDLDALVYSIVGNGTKGTAAITNTATGAFTYTPSANAFGPDSFTFRVFDGTVHSAVATVSVTIGAINDVPVANAGSLAVVEDTPKTGTLTASDVEAQPLVYSVVSNGSKGVAVVTNPSTGAYTYTPNLNAIDSDSFTFRAFDGTDYSAAASVSVSISQVNDAPSFTKGADRVVNEDSGAATVLNWATNLSAGPADESGQALNFIVSNNNTALFSAQPAISPVGTLTFTPAANAFGTATVTVQLHDNGGGSDTSAPQTFTITVNAVNDVPAFVKGPNQAFVGAVPAQTIANWATGLSAGPANEAGQTLNFIVGSSNTSLFSVQPAISPTGTLTFTPAANVFATATITVQVRDNGGVANGGVDTSAAQTFTISIAKASTATVVTSSSAPSLFGVPVTLTATVGVVAPGLGVPAGNVTFKDGATTIGTAALSGGVASLTTSTLSVATHSITAVYAGNSTFLGSTSPAFSQVISPSATLTVTFKVHALQDTTNKPKVKTIAVPNAVVKVFSIGTPCSGNIFTIINPKKWGLIYDGPDGPGGVEGCAPVTVGSYQAVGTTDVNGVTTIIVPPTTTTRYLVIGRATNFDYVQTANSPDPLYSQNPVLNLNAGALKNVPLSLLATFGGKIVPGAQTEFFGSYLNVIQPEYVEWTENVEEYPVVMVAQGDWSLTTGVTPPEGFIPDVPTLSAQVADTTSAVQFIMTDVGSEWTETVINHSIVHLGTTTTTSGTIPMIDKKVTTAKNDSPKVMHDSAATTLDLMVNDKVNHQRKPIFITSITSALNGTAVLAADGLSVSYTPAPGYSGIDTFTYTITDAIGDSSTGNVAVNVLPTPEVSVKTDTILEGNDGLSAGSVNVVLSNQSLVPVTVSYAMANGTATAGADYVAATGTLTFPPLTTSLPIALQAMGDTLAEVNEKFTVTLANPTNATIAAEPGGSITITDDDPPEILIAPTATITELNSGSDNVGITVTLSQPHDISVWVSYVTAPGTALAGSDYIHSTGTVQFLPGTTSKMIYIPVYYDTIGEANEVFYVDLHTPLNGTLTEATRATVTIVNDDVSTLVTSTSAELGAGTLEGGAYLAETANGEITLKPVVGEEFSGSSLPAGWNTTAVEAGGTSAVANGAVAVDGAALRAPLAYAAGRTLEFHATFSGAPDQSIGFSNATTPLAVPMAMFVVKADRQLYARSVMGTRVMESPMSGVNWLNQAVTYKIVWNTGSAQYFVNGVAMITHSSMAYGTTTMRPTVIDGHTDAITTSVGWIRLTPYAASGTFTSAVIDAGDVVKAWTKLTASASVVSGTTMTLTYRIGDTPVPDGTWTAFTATGTGGVISGSSQFIQFRIQATSTNVTKTPIVNDVTVSFKR